MAKLSLLLLSALVLSGSALRLRAHKRKTVVDWGSSDLQVITINTNRQDSSIELKHIGANTSMIQANIGAGKTWTGFKSKVNFLHDWLQEQPITGNGLVAFMDSDVMWGGCSQETFLARYKDILKASDAQIVVGAELGCFDASPWTCKKYPNISTWAQNKYDIGKWEKQANCECLGGSPGLCGAPCSSPPQMRHLNSGFVLGSVKALRQVNEYMLGLYAQGKVHKTDQEALSMYYHDSLTDTSLPAIALDYNSDLVTNLYRVPATHSDAVFDKIVSGESCFLHGNGDTGKAFIKVLQGKAHDWQQKA